MITIEGEFASRNLLFVSESRDARSSAPCLQRVAGAVPGGGVLLVLVTTA
nr:hypothetical protein [Streptomyces sp. S501]